MKKTCKKCKEEKCVSEYAVCRRNTDGLQYQCKSCRSAYYFKNKKRLNRASVKYQAERMRTDPAFRLSKLLRGRLYTALDGGYKESSTMDLLGCTLDELKEHIASQFTGSMRWGDRSSFHLDHIIPLSAFDLNDPMQLSYAMNWRNHQPLTKEDNLRKADKYCPKELKKYLASTLMEYREKGKG